MASTSLSKPTILFPSNTPFLYLPSKPNSLPFSFRRKLTTHHRTLIPLVAQTSGWAPQESDNTVTEEEEEEGEEEEELEVGDGVSAELEGEGEVEEGGDFVEEESYPEPPEDAKLFVGNLPYDVDSQQLAELFNQAGVVELAEVIYNRETDQSRGFGFISMSTVEEAEKAVEMFNRYDYNGRLLTVNKAAPRGARPERPAQEFESSFRIYVGNLPWQVDDARLEQVFSEHGKVVSARVVSDRETGRSRGFGFVTMASQDEQQDAISALDGQIQPYRQQSIRNHTPQKLSSKFFGPYKVLEKIGSVAYRLQLPEGAAIHPVFHVSKLKKCYGEHLPSVSSDIPSWWVEDDHSEEPETVLDRRVYKKNNQMGIDLLIKWKNSGVEEASWVDIDTFRRRFPNFELGASSFLSGEELSGTQ